MTDCFASISQQQYKDFEVIVVDDGSNETCAKNIDYLSKKFFTRYRVIHTANNGVSKARNLGIKCATGNYIAFADGDDIVCPCMLMDAYQVLQKYDLDILYGMTQCMNEGELCIRKQDRCLPVSVDFLDRKGQNELYCHMFNVSRDRFKCGKRYVSRGPIARVVKKALLNRIYLMKSWLLVKMKNGICAFCQIQFERVLLKNYGTIIFSGKIQLYTDFGMIL